MMNQHMMNQRMMTPPDDFIDFEDPDDEFDEVYLAIILSLGSVIIIVIAATIALGCCCYHRRMRKRDLAALTEKGGVIVLNDDLHCANQEGRLVVNVSLLDARRVRYGCNNYNYIWLSYAIC